MIAKFLKSVSLVLVAASVLAQSSFQVENSKWRQEREAKLKAEDGWLTVSGLFWLRAGENTFGTSSEHRIRLPKGSAPSSVGSLELDNGVVTLRVSSDANVRVNNQPVGHYEMRFDNEKQPEPFTVGSLTFSVIKRGERYGLRLRDKNSLARRQFKGLRWFPARESYRVTASFVPDADPKEIIIMNVLGDEVKMRSPGTLSFELNGQKYQLRPVIEDDKKLFILFKDLTAGKTTYSAGRFLYAELPKEGTVVLDFNRSENPPCAFTLYATCPLPPKQNFLPVAIAAGEKDFHLKDAK